MWLKIESLRLRICVVLAFGFLGLGGGYGDVGLWKEFCVFGLMCIWDFSLDMGWVMALFQGLGLL